jgi:uncharacterized protein YdeI (YjbR/CyaY-like superfamily)
MGADKEVETFYAPGRREWRQWLEENHDSRQSIWLIYYKKNSDKPRVAYSDAVDEALCFGWIDSTSRPLDDEKYMQYFTRRKPKSIWSRINKEKVERLIGAGLMTEAGFAAVETAKQNGSWTILDDAEALIVSADLAASLQKNPKADAYFSSLSRTDKRNMLQWLALAKRPETRQKRINEIADLAGREMKPKQFK